ALGRASRDHAAAPAAARSPGRRPGLPARASLLVQSQVLPGVASALSLRRAAERPAARGPRLSAPRAAARAARPLGEAGAAEAADAPVTLTPVAQPATRSLGRLSEIAQVMVRHGFGYFLEAHKLTDLLPGRSSEARLAAAAADGAGSARGQHLRELLDGLGPTFVKIGQLLSTRPVAVPPGIIDVLRGRQDDVCPVPSEQACAQDQQG